MKLLSHFILITKHKFTVMNLCFKCGLYKQGLLHDLSKYSLVEMRCGSKYFNGKISPNAMERNEKGYSESWLHHKGRNKHHYEYWVDFSDDGIKYVEMPIKYIIEMFCDRVAATKIYLSDEYQDNSALEYFLKTENNMAMHIKSKVILKTLLEHLSLKGLDDTIELIKKEYLKKSC